MWLRGGGAIVFTRGRACADKRSSAARPPHTHRAVVPLPGRRSRGNAEKKAKPADKPGSVVDSHSSRRYVTAALKQPTRTRHGPCHCVPIWPCSEWGLPCRSVAGLAVRSYRTISPLPSCSRSLGRYLSVALSVGSRRPGVTWHSALRSPDFPRRLRRDVATVWPTSPACSVAAARRRHRAPG